MPTKLIILAAGMGTRLRPLTDDRPKCMVEYHGAPLLTHILEAAKICGLSDIVVIGGYKPEAIRAPGAKLRLNPHYDTTNMVATLFSAEDEIDGADIIVSYSDIVYRPPVLKALIGAEDEFTVVVDKKWRELWSQRMSDPLADAETMRIDAEGCIIELGKKPSSYDEIQGQYIGLFKLRQSVLSDVKKFYHSLDRSAKYDGKNFDNMFMTSFIQLVIDRLMPVKALPINGGWIEIDAVSDLQFEMI